MSQLPLDLWGYILELIRQDSLSDLASIASTSKSFLAFCQPLLYHTFSVDDQDAAHAAAKWQRLFDNPKLRTYVKDLTVPAVGHQIEQTEGAAPGSLESLLQLGRLEPKLAPKSIKWTINRNTDLSESLTSLAAVFPECRISVSDYTGQPVTSAPNLVSLQGTVELSSQPLNHFEPVLRKTPNLRILDITIYRQYGCVRRLLKAPAFIASERTGVAGHQYPALEKLSLDGFYMETWPDWMDWSRLHTLELLQGNTLSCLEASDPIAVRLPALRRLCIQQWHLSQDHRFSYLDSLSNVLETTVPLEELELEGPYQSLIPVIARVHGGTLRKLSVHEHETPYDRQRRTITRESLEILGDQFPRLEALHIDVDQDEKREESGISFKDVFELLDGKKFSAVKHLHMLTLLGIACTLSERTPTRVKPLILSSLHHISNLSTFCIRAGEQRLPPAGRPAAWVSWESQNYATCTVKMVGRDHIVGTLTRGSSRYRRWRSHEDEKLAFRRNGLKWVEV